MRRREFLAASCAAGLAPLGSLAAAAKAKEGKQLLELRLYQVESDEQRKKLDAFLGDAAVPALNRIGIRPVGAFEMATAGERNLYVLLPHASAESMVTATSRLLSDATFVKDGDAYLKAPKSAPLYARVESWLLLAFDAVPRVEVHSRKDTRICQLRRYESHSVERGQKKIEMFNTGGEIAVFRRSGMDPVFFGEALIGTFLPNLTYMLVFDDADAQKQAWARFSADPAWKKLRSDPAYKDTVSRITNIILRPTAYSQI